MLTERLASAIQSSADFLFVPVLVIVLFGTGIFLTLRFGFVQVRRFPDALRAFNDRHGRRGMARGAVIVILSDGWERGEPLLVGREMERLARLAYRIVWVNPRVSASGFSPRVGGMAAALPHVDALVSGHSLDALGEVADAIGAERGTATWEPEPPAPGRHGTG